MCDSVAFWNRDHNSSHPCLLLCSQNELYYTLLRAVAVVTHNASLVKKHSILLRCGASVLGRMGL